ncbi:SprT family zinc-dependent metalloprotease [Phaeobacter sp. QD34_3]|uniref:M48 family metallopeptidase n=1 Tax=unclassified Phaeobacter TaxID=2621772 RepID=UPI00237F0ED7|nr:MULTISPECIES: SprT family zinc-dependent metalloprotease [unclassified Phaeobacter]MDE4132633.1 SprT family zinc-dependent metalloprotease [Phaeobacter sp. QD34_3]MDE4136269.1 SprT family zinc-dependent metalloprotease [Phaeobacter sp. QD34_24]MDE4174371.1 SprT family zinc-dependent metalloprotease [Phaeobacter sp. PT47_59]
MSAHHLPGDPPVPLILRRSARARRISLRVSSLDGRVTITLPRTLPEREALEFAVEKEGWIRGHLARRPDNVDVTFGTLLPVAGQELQVVPGQGRGVRITGGEIAVPGARPAKPLERYLRELARDRLAGASDEYAARLGRGFSRIVLRDTRSRWGSCSSAGALMYSWRLILAPAEVLRYVAAHEVAHLQEMNHSAAFWSLVEDLYGDYAAPRAWLRENGSALHRYRFGS